MPEQPNLWNETRKKTRKVMKFIHGLQPDRTWDPNQLKEFEETKGKALQLTTPNRMLELIDYKPGGAVGLYDVINKEATRL